MFKFFRKSRQASSEAEVNLTTAFARKRLERSMPGEAGALYSARFGSLV